MSKPKIVAIAPPDLYALKALEPIAGQADIIISNDEAKVREHLPTADIILNSSLTGRAVPLSKLWSEAIKVRWVHSLSAGVDNLLFPELVKSPVPITNARGVFKRPLAEFVILGMLFFYKQVRKLIDDQRGHRWDPFSVDWLPGKVMGIVGYGEIGRECALLARAMGVKIHAVRRRPKNSEGDELIERVFAPDQLGDMLSEIDVLVVAAPLTPQTRHMIGEPQLRAMKPSALVMNVGRGPLIDEKALEKALKEKWIAGAALDVFEEEPLPANHPFYDMDNILLSPHCTDRTIEPDWLILSVNCFVENFRRFTHGEELLNIVDKEAGY